MTAEKILVKPDPIYCPTCGWRGSELEALMADWLVCPECDGPVEVESDEPLIVLPALDETR